MAVLSSINASNQKLYKQPFQEIKRG
jgi:hypothetical protein